MTDRDGDPVQHYGYQPYGNERYKHNTSAFSVTNRFTGQQLDEDIGLYYYGARYYDPELGRFIQPDSVVPGSGSQALNRYSYCFNNPLIFTDPTGNTPLTIFFAFNEAIKAEAAAQGRYWNAAADSISGAFDYLGSGLIACAPGGALGALITGDDPGMAAATSGIHFTIPGGLFGEEGVFSEFISKGSLTDQYLKEFAAAMSVGTPYYNELYGLCKSEDLPWYKKWGLLITIPSLSGFCLVGGGVGHQLIWIPGKGWRTYTYPQGGISNPGGTANLGLGCVFNITKHGDYLGKYKNLQLISPLTQYGSFGADVSWYKGQPTAISIDWGISNGGISYMRQHYMYTETVPGKVANTINRVIEAPENFKLHNPHMEQLNEVIEQIEEGDWDPY